MNKVINWDRPMVEHPVGAYPLKGLEYKGAGRAWAAVNSDGEIVALKYMSDYDPRNLLGYRHFPENDTDFMVQWRKRHPRAEPPKPNNRRDSRYLRFVEEVRMEREQEAGGFGHWRKCWRDWLEAFAGPGGFVVGGMCSCWDFMAV